MDCDRYGTGSLPPIYNDYLLLGGSICPSRKDKYSSQDLRKFIVAHKSKDIDT
jgi:hypothetical protein